MRTRLTWHRLKVEMLLSSYSKILMVSKAQVLSASKPDFSDIITLQASGVPGKHDRISGCSRVLGLQQSIILVIEYSHKKCTADTPLRH